MAKMPELVELHEEYGDEGLVVIGINFDGEVAAAKEAMAGHGLTWPQVHASTAAAGREDLWERIPDIGALPRVFLVDREGVLRADVYPSDLRGQVEEVLGR